MKNRFIIVGNQNKSWILREPFYDIINGKYENASFVEPYVFPDNDIAQEYINYFRGQKGSPYFNAKWRRYSVFNNLEFEHDEHVYIIFLYGRDIDRLFDVILIRRLKEQYCNRIRIILLLLDSIDVTPEINGWHKVAKIFNNFDKVITFDRKDAEEYNLILTTTPYEKRIVEFHGEKSDMFFCGSDKGRGELILSLAQAAKDHGVIANFKVADCKFDDNHEGIIPIKKYIPYARMLSDVVTTNCIVEILSEGQSSSSLRYYEAVVFNKKLLTNNPDICQMPLYDSRYMKCFKNVADIDFNWVKEKIKIDYKYKDEFSVKLLMDKCIHECESLPENVSVYPKISVILPTYNREKTIMRAVNSVLNQTFSNLELIIVDDGSTDDTMNILAKIKDPRVKIISQEHSGACEARNNAIMNCATGEYIAFQDSDDLWQPNKLKEQLQIFVANIGVDVVFSNGDRYSLDGQLKPLVLESSLVEGIVSKYDLQAFSKVSTQTILARKECFEIIRFDPEMPRLQDYDLVIRLCEIFNFYYINKKLVTLYESSDSISVDPRKAIAARFKLIQKYPNIMSQNLRMFESSISSIKHNLGLISQCNEKTKFELDIANRLREAESEIRTLQNRNICITTEKNKNTDDLSIIIPYRNTAKTLEKLLKSIFQENIAVEKVQVIVINDNSSKNLEHYSRIKNEFNDRVTFFDNNSAKKNAGSARNIGIRCSTGRYLLFADADDYFVDGWYDAVKQYFNFDYDVVFFEPISSCRGSNTISTRHVRYSRLVDSYVRNPNKDNEDKLRYEYIVPWSKLIKRDLIISNDITFDEVPYSNDNMFSVKCGCLARSLCASKSVIYNAVDYPESLTKTKSFNAFYERECVRCNRYNFVKSEVGSKRFLKLDICVLGFASMIKIIMQWLRHDVTSSDIKKLYSLYKSKNISILPNPIYISRNIGRLFRYAVKIDKKY